jgi:1-acyl-sn-glycerol-3-phosphate acyltransferase
LKLQTFFFRSYVGYEVEGLENIPTKGPVLIVFYHAALPIDFYYLFAKIWLYRNRRVRVVADKFVFKIPGRLKNLNRKREKFLAVS